MPTRKAKQAGVGTSRWLQSKVAVTETCGEVFFDRALVFAINDGNDHGSVLLERIEQTVRLIELLPRLDRFSLVPYRFPGGIFDQHPVKRSRRAKRLAVHNRNYSIALPDLFYLRFRFDSYADVVWAWRKFYIDQRWWI